MRNGMIDYKMCRYQGGDWQFVGSMELFNRHYQVEEDDCAWCGWVLIVFLALAATAGALL